MLDLPVGQHKGLGVMRGSAVILASSFRGDAQHRTRNLELPRCAIAHLRSGPADHPGMTTETSISLGQILDRRFVCRKTTKFAIVGIVFR